MSKPLLADTWMYTSGMGFASLLWSAETGRGR